MQHQTIGYVIGALVLLAFVAIPPLKLWAWRRRWAVKTLAGVPVRFELEADDHVLGSSRMKLERAIAVGIEKTIEVVKETLPEAKGVDVFRVIVRSEHHVAAYAGLGELGGEVRTERAFMFTPLVPVVIVQRPGVAYYIAHEVCAHVVSYRLGLGFNPGHSNPVLASIEREAKRRIGITLGTDAGDVSISFA